MRPVRNPTTPRSLPYAVEISRDLEFTSVTPQVALDFNFVVDVAVIKSNKTVLMHHMTVVNARWARAGGRGATGAAAGGRGDQR
jgi:hypothetical protein